MGPGEANQNTKQPERDRWSVSSPARRKPAKKKKKSMLSESSELEISSAGNDT